MTIIDRLGYASDSLSWDVSFEYIAKMVVAWLYTKTSKFDSNIHRLSWYVYYIFKMAAHVNITTTVHPCIQSLARQSATTPTDLFKGTRARAFLRKFNFVIFSC